MKKSEALNILGLRDGFSEDELKRAHRKKVIENHPDRFQDPTQKAQAEERTKRINEANDVLKSGKWEPEFGAGYAGATGAGPYRSPYVNYGNPNSGPEWVQVDPETFRRWAEQAQQQNGYDPFNPFASYTYTQAQPTPEQQAEQAHQDMRIGLIMLAVKVAICGVLLLQGHVFDAALTWAVITYLLLLASRFGGCSWIVILFLIPVFYNTAGMLELAAQRGGVFSIAIIGMLFISALYFDFRDILDAVRRYRATRKDVNQS